MQLEARDDILGTKIFPVLKKMKNHSTEETEILTRKDASEQLDLSDNERHAEKTTDAACQRLQSIDGNPNTSTRATYCSATWGLSVSSVADTARGTCASFPSAKEFAKWFMQKGAVDTSLLASLLFTDEASFIREGVFNTHQHGTRNHTAQHRFAINL
ncbi:hypothetical protein HNY73_005716 [Argiope bruennichi]|uniref:Uncharacterized protein n=1 Tax=Argiope bruennichi TaxID=94029 RepID=A0A8T0FMV3_ARGBR|nr:hypothetical protein HNY73_005716 [Argiope bruennichi]